MIRFHVEPDTWQECKPDAIIHIKITSNNYVTAKPTLLQITRFCLIVIIISNVKHTMVNYGVRLSTIVDGRRTIDGQPSTIVDNRRQSSTIVDDRQLI